MISNVHLNERSRRILTPGGLLHLSPPFTPPEGEHTYQKGLYQAEALRFFYTGYSFIKLHIRELQPYEGSYREDRTMLCAYAC